MRLVRRKFSVSKNEAGFRLDVFLTEKLEDFSRAWIQKLIKDGKIRLNGQKISASRRLKAGDRVDGSFDPPPGISLEPDRSLDGKIKVVFENGDFLVINKPVGLVVHPSSATPSGTLVNWLLWKYPEIQGVGEDKLRPGLVHRLDKETSGLMVIAKNQDSFRWLKRAFAGRKVSKRYWALVHGELKDDRGIISYPVGRSQNNPTRQIAYRSKETAPLTARPALTHWRALERYDGFTFVELAPVTGRMHQLRIHLKAVGHPVAGDDKYSSSKLKSPKGLGRMFLHAFSLKFQEPRGRRFSFSAPLPAELRAALKNLVPVVE